MNQSVTATTPKLTSSQQTALLYLEFRPKERRWHRMMVVSQSTFQALARRGLALLGSAWRLTDAGRAALPPLPSAEHKLLVQIAGSGATGLFIMQPALPEIRAAIVNLGHRDLVEIRAAAVVDGAGLDGFLCFITPAGQKRLSS